MSPITTPAGLASKIAQRDLVAGAAPALAFDLRVFEDQATPTQSASRCRRATAPRCCIALRCP